MTIWPETYDGAWTLSSAVTRSGVGLHTGDRVAVTLCPSGRPGFWVSWEEDPAHPPVHLSPSQVRESQLCTTLDFGDRRLATVEHLLAALAGTGLTHVELRVSGAEVPLLDGSALQWVEAIAEAGLSQAGSPSAQKPVLTKPIALHRGASVITAVPAEHFSLVGVIDFPQPDQLRAAGLIQGGALDNALVCDGDAWINPPLRFADEPVRHKLLDLIGDLALVGFPSAQVLVYRGSHGLHTDLAAALAASLSPNH